MVLFLCWVAQILVCCCSFSRLTLHFCDSQCCSQHLQWRHWFFPAPWWNEARPWDDDDRCCWWCTMPHGCPVNCSVWSLYHSYDALQHKQAHQTASFVFPFRPELSWTIESVTGRLARKRLMDLSLVVVLSLPTADPDWQLLPFRTQPACQWWSYQATLDLNIGAHPGCIMYLCSS